MGILKLAAVAGEQIFAEGPARQQEEPTRRYTRQPDDQKRSGDRDFGLESDDVYEKRDGKNRTTAPGQSQHQADDETASDDGGD